MKTPKDLRHFDRRYREGKKMQLITELALLKQQVIHQAEETVKRIDQLVSYIQPPKKIKK